MRCFIGADAKQESSLIPNKLVFPTQGPNEKVIGTACSIMGQMLRKAGGNGETLSGIGISCGGPLDLARGRILSPPYLYGWNDVPVADLVEEQLGYKPRLEKDANASALAEWKFGAATGCHRIPHLWPD